MQIFLARGNQRIIHQAEKEIIAWARESVVSIQDIKINDKLNINNISTKRPTPKKNEIPANMFFKILNKKVKNKIPKNKKLKYSDLK